MRRKWLMLAVVPVLLMGCSSTAASVEPDSAPSKTDVFLQVVRDRSENLAGASDAQLIKVAKATCAAFDEGATVADLAVAADGTGVSATDVGVIGGAGTAAFCPEYSDLWGE